MSNDWRLLTIFAGLFDLCLKKKTYVLCSSDYDKYVCNKNKTKHSDNSSYALFIHMNYEDKVEVCF